MSVSNLSSGIRTGVCTSSSRPTNPYTGQVILETDTNLLFSWNGSSWVAPSLVSPALTSIPTAPTAAASTSTTQIATTAFVTTADNLKANIASPSFTGSATFAGTVSPSATNTYDLGNASFRWRNIYTQDLHLSNGIGDYTVVEGEEDLYLVNHKTNRSFKFALVEVDSSEVPKLSET